MNSPADELIARLRRNPDDYPAFVALRAHYHQLGDWPSLVNLLEGWASRAPDARAAAQAFFEAADLALGALGDRARGTSLYERALERNPAHLDAYARLEAVAEEFGDLRRVAEVLERRAEATLHAAGDAPGSAAVYLQLGELYEQRFERSDRALLHYRRAWELDPQLVAAIYAAREIYRHAGNFHAAAQLYEQEVAAETDPTRRVSLQRELAHLYAERLGELDAALAVLERALAGAPGDLGVMHDLATMLLRRADQRAGSAAGTADKVRAADFLYQMAQRVPPEHAVSYAEAALDAAPDHEGALALLDRVAHELGRSDLLPARWVGFLQVAPDAPAARALRRRLGEAYVEAGQLDDAIVCFEPLLDEGDAAAAERLVELYRYAGRDADVARALGVALPGLPPAQRAARLLELMDLRVAAGDRAGAAEDARALLQLDPASPEALAFLETELRTTGAWEPLRALLRDAARVPGVSVEARKQRLREVAALSTERLADPEGAVEAWRSLCTLDPADADARATFGALLERLGRWDELAQVLEREAVASYDPQASAGVLRRLARLHRDQRGDLGAATDAWGRLLGHAPDDDEALVEVCGLLLTLDRHAEAVPLLRRRIERAPRAERATLLRTLAAVLDEQLDDAEGAFEASARVLDEEPGNLEALARMARIDEAAGRFERLLQTLSYRAEIGPPAERAGTLARMGAVADRELGDLDRAAEYLGQALDLAPGDAAALDALCDVYDRAQRFRDLVELLRGRAIAESAADVRAELFRRIARILDQRVRNEDAAAEAWDEVLAAGEDEEALLALVRRARRTEDAAALEPLLGRLGACVTDAAEACDLAVERADLCAGTLAQPERAVPLLRDVLARLAPGHLPAIHRLVTLAERFADDALLAEALEHQLAATDDAGLRAPVAERLADLYEHRVRDAEAAIRALSAWADADLTDPAPQQRMVRLLESLERWPALVDALDALAGLEQDDTVVSALVRRAADVAWTRLGDGDGAFRRLAERVEDAADAEAEDALRILARALTQGPASGGERLAELYARLAQDEGAGAAGQARRWADAAGVYETYLGDAQRALDAALRALALELGEPSRLAEVDRLAGLAGAWDRLGQVYETLLRRATTPAQKVALLVRHAQLLDERGRDAGAALDRALRACALAPDDDDVLAVAEDLAPRAGRAEELLVVYERRKAAATDDARRVETLLRAARLAETALRDRDRALLYVAQAVALTTRSPALGARVEELVAGFDAAAAGPSGAPDQRARRGLVAIYQRLADSAPEAADSAHLQSRAAQLLDAGLGDARSAFAALRQAATATPGSAEVLDALTALALRSAQLPALDAHLAELVREAFDPRTATALMRRRAALLANELARPADAAEVYQQLLALAPGDVDAARALRACLARAGRHQDLLVAIDRALETTREPAARAALLTEAARTWEGPLHNRYEALDLWKKVRALVPDDPDAAEAIARLDQSLRRPSRDDDEDDTLLGTRRQERAPEAAAPRARVDDAPLEESHGDADTTPPGAPTALVEPASLPREATPAVRLEPPAAASAPDDDATGERVLPPAQSGATGRDDADLANITDAREAPPSEASQFDDDDAPPPAGATDTPLAALDDDDATPLEALDDGAEALDDDVESLEDEVESIDDAEVLDDDAEAVDDADARAALPERALEDALEDESLEGEFEELDAAPPRRDPTVAPPPPPRPPTMGPPPPPPRAPSLAPPSPPAVAMTRPPPPPPPPPAGDFSAPRSFAPPPPPPPPAGDFSAPRSFAPPPPPPPAPSSSTPPPPPRRR
jgi:tetratricopeptide (TPR) repeat protein